MHRAGVISHRNRPDGLSSINTTVVDHERTGVINHHYRHEVGINRAMVDHERTGVTNHPYRHEVGRERTGVFHHRFRHETIISHEGATP